MCHLFPGSRPQNKPHTRPSTADHSEGHTYKRVRCARSDSARGARPGGAVRTHRGAARRAAVSPRRSWCTRPLRSGQGHNLFTSLQVGRSRSHRTAHAQAHAARALGLNESQTAASHKAYPTLCAAQSTRGRAQSGQIGPAAAPCGREDGRGTAAASELQCSSSVGGPRPKARPIPCHPTASARRAAAPSRAPCRRPHAPGPWHGRGRKRAISRSKSGPRRNARERTGCGPRRLARRPAHAHADGLRAYLAWSPRRSRALQIRVRPLP